MSPSAITFYILSALIITSALLTIISRRIFRAAIFLLFSLVGIAGIYFIMDVEFVAALQIIVYVGGIVVLIIFSIFLTHQAGEKLPKKLNKRMIRGSLLALAGFATFLYVFLNHSFTENYNHPFDSKIETIGRQLFDYKSHGYVLPFEIISVLLLAALIGSIVIAIKTRKDQ